MAAIISVALQKGGTGKTTVTRNVAGCMAAQGHRVLMIDADPQHSLTNITLQQRPPVGLAAVMGATEPGQIAIQEIIKPVGPGLDIAPASIDLAVSESSLILRRARELILSRAIEGIASAYNYILIDCPPSLGLLMTNALIAADVVVMPVTLDRMGQDSAGLFLQTLADLQSDYPQAARLLGTVASKADLRTVLAREVLAAYQSRADLKMFETVIPATIKFEESALMGQAIHDYDPEGRAAAAIDELTAEIIERVNRGN